MQLTIEIQVVVSYQEIRMISGIYSLTHIFEFKCSGITFL